MRLAVADVVSPSYFPAAAAVTLGFFAAEGLDVSLVHISPLDDCVAALRDGAMDFIGASAHAPLLAFPEWAGVKLLCAQAQGTYWVLVMRKDLCIARGDLRALRGRRIAAVPAVGAALRRLLLAAGLDPAAEAIEIGTPPGGLAPGVNFGVAAARALEDGAIDGFFANAMGAEVAVRRGIGTIVLDIRRGDGPKEAFHYTLPAIAATDRLLAEAPDKAAAAVRAIVRTQAALRQDPERASDVGRKLFPAFEATLIAELVRRDLPYYDAALSPAFIAAMNRYARAIGLLHGEVDYESIVATRFRPLWRPDATPG